ncbi:MAG: bifunctional hydroxymethylpyrimidine kinase/phosphomethylpyrimidine kinase [Lachnospiraceae bacterium]
MKKIAVINDISGLGKCSLGAAIPVISVLGHQVCPIPTSVYTAQTGYASYHMRDLKALMEFTVADWRKAGERMDGFYSGYLSSAEQYEQVLTIYEGLKKEDSFLLVDPIMGDHGEAFPIYSDALRQGMQELIRSADVTTPNLTEACLLTSDSFEDVEKYPQKEDRLKVVEEIGMKIKQISQKKMTVIITGIRYTDVPAQKKWIGNFCIEEDKSIYLEQSDLLLSYSGTGDLLASCICGYLMNGVKIEEAIQKTMHFLELSIREAMRLNMPSNAGVCFEPYLFELLDHK